MKTLGSVLAGFSASVLLASPAEWMVHRYMLHPKTRNFINRNSAIGHNDKHHGAYNGPAHYYRDITNEHEVIHFSKGDVALIHGVSAGIGYGIYKTLASRVYEEEGVGFVSGFIAGTAAYYAAYEILHHYMHDIGKRRLEINRVLGNVIQGEPDNNLRLSKPLLDDLCNEVELRVDARKELPYPDSLLERLSAQIAYNRTEAHEARTGLTNIRVADPAGALMVTTAEMLRREREHHDTLGAWGRLKYAGKRFIHRQMRNSPAFQYIDNHHFVHHRRFMQNLNVVFPLADVALGTQVKSSKEYLENEKAYWLCPNSPDVKKFELADSALLSVK